MNEFIKQWFCWLEQGMEKISEEEADRLLKSCGQNCAKGGVLDLYKSMYKQTGENMDEFFVKMNDFDDVAGEVVCPGKEYNLYFKRCFCELHSQGYVSSSKLCRCSRQSILYVMNELQPDSTWDVTIEESVLRGDSHCKMRIKKMS